jgi:hypothetical protein
LSARHRASERPTINERQARKCAAGEEKGPSSLDRLVLACAAPRDRDKVVEIHLGDAAAGPLLRSLVEDGRLAVIHAAPFHVRLDEVVLRTQSRGCHGGSASQLMGD